MLIMMNMIKLFYYLLVSMQTLAADVQGLRKGLDLTKSERDKQPDNFIIFVSICDLICFHKGSTVALTSDTDFKGR